jgi:Beta-galactosidase, domain 3
MKRLLTLLFVLATVAATLVTQGTAGMARTAPANTLLAGGRDVAVLYGTDGTAGQTDLRYSSPPSVTVLDGTLRSSYDPSTGDEELSYTHSWLIRVLISGGGRRPLLLLIGTDATAATFWQAGTSAGPVLVRGTSLVRSAQVTGDTAILNADIANSGDVEVFGPRSCGGSSLTAGR